LIDNVGGMLLLSGIALTNRAIVVRSLSYRAQFTRVALGTARFWTLIYAFAHLPLVDATALSYLQSSFLVLFSWALLHEEVGVDRWLRVIFGMVGALLVVRPAFSSHAHWLAYAIGLTQPAISALTSVSTKWTYRKGDAVNTTYFWIATCNFSFAMLIAAFFASHNLSALPPWPAVLAIMICGPAGTYLLLWAQRQTDLSRLAPFGYFRLVWNVAFGVLVFAERPSTTTVCGIVLILVSCFLPRPAQVRARWQASRMYSSSS
jgi:drug/metabolite transporter (DMT)-like permease